MTGRILARDDYRLQITYRTTLSGHVVAGVVAAVIAAVVVFWWGL